MYRYIAQFIDDHKPAVGPKRNPRGRTLCSPLPYGHDDPTTAAIFARQTACLFLFRSEALGALLLSFSNPTLLKVDVSAEWGLAAFVDRERWWALRSVIRAITRATGRTSRLHYTIRPGEHRSVDARGHT